MCAKINLSDISQLEQFEDLIFPCLNSTTSCVQIQAENMGVSIYENRRNVQRSPRRPRKIFGAVGFDGDHKNFSMKFIPQEESDELFDDDYFKKQPSFKTGFNFNYTVDGKFIISNMNSILTKF